MSMGDNHSEECYLIIRLIEIILKEGIGDEVLEKQMVSGQNWYRTLMPYFGEKNVEC